MKKPDLNQIWETFIKIPSEITPEGNRIITYNILLDMIRFKIHSMISRLKDNGIINWYCFLIHDRKSGVPTSENDDNPYFHIRFELKKGIKPNDFLPDYCVMTRKIKREWVEKISGIEKSILKNEQIEEAWKIIGEQSEWVMNMLNIHKETVEIPPKQIVQFLHFYSNMTQLQIR